MAASNLHRRKHGIIIYFWVLTILTSWPCIVLARASWIIPKHPTSKGFLQYRKVYCPSHCDSLLPTVAKTSLPQRLIGRSRIYNNVLPLESSILPDIGSSNVKNKILVLGGTGFVGSRVVEILRQKNIPFIATSTKGLGGTVPLDLTNENASNQLLELCQKNEISTIISAVGSIFTTRDYEINSSSGRTIAALFESDLDSINSVRRYIFVGNSPRIRNVSKNLPALQEYARGKEESERLIQKTFSQKSNDFSYCIVKPTFIYGGDEFGSNPPRVPNGIGQIGEALLGLYPIQATTEALPDLPGALLEAPISVDAVAGAIVNAAIGLCDETKSLDTREDIIMAASKRSRAIDEDSSRTDQPQNDMRREELKMILSQRATEFTAEENFAMLEELEKLRPATIRPTDDPSLNGRWDFCFDVEPDVGTGLIKDLFEGEGPEWIRQIVDFQGVHMEISDKQSTVRLVVSVALLGKQTDLILNTSLSPAPDNPDGTMFLEKFEGIELSGVKLPYPNAWKKSRYLEFSYLDDEFAIARGSGGEPHFLLRGSN